MDYKEFKKIREIEGDNHKYNYKGYDVEIIRHPSLLHLCTYITIPKTHPNYNKDLTYDKCYKLFELPGQEWTYDKYTDKGFVLGFDCAHLGQYSPGMDKIFEENGMINPAIDPTEIYWTMEMCKETINNAIDLWEK